MRYYYLDYINNTEEEYKDFDEFIEGICWNRDIAAENGDRVTTKKRLLQVIKPDEEFYMEINGAGFLICENINLYKW